MSAVKAGSVVKGLSEESLGIITGKESSTFYFSPSVVPNEPLYVHAVGKKDDNKALCLVSQLNGAKITLAIPMDSEILDAEETKKYLTKRAASLKAQGFQRPKVQDSTGPVFGADPEVFVVDGNTNTVVPAWEFLPSKEESGGLGGKISNEHWDGFQAEAQLKPSHCHQYLVDHIQLGLANILTAARKVNPAAKLVPDTVVRVPIDMMFQASDQHVNLGCAPSQNVYPDEEQLVISDPRQLAVRFAGGHIHYGGALADWEFDLPHIVRTLDRIFGVISVSILQGLEDPIRRKFYGKAGEYRLPPHGLEYRTPSSAMLCHPVVTHLCLDIARACMRLGAFHQDVVWECDEQEAREIINNCDVTGAKKVLKRNQTIMEALLGCLYSSISYSDYKNRQTMSIVMDGARNCLETADMYKAWRLDGTWAKHSGSANCSVYTLTGIKRRETTDGAESEGGRVALAA